MRLGEVLVPWVAVVDIFGFNGRVSATLADFNLALFLRSSRSLAAIPVLVLLSAAPRTPIPAFETKTNCTLQFASTL